MNYIKNTMGPMKLRRSRRSKIGKTYFLGVDVGTSSTKAIVFDREGIVIAEGKSAYRIMSTQAGWVEQKAIWWWDALKKAVKETLQSSSIDPKNLRGIGITHQRMTAVPVNKEINPIGNAILWNDMRCTEEAEWANKNVGRKKIFERTRYPPGLWTVYKAMWLKDHNPDIYRNMYKFLLVPDYLIYKLTGRLLTSQGAAVTTGCLDISNPSRWEKDILKSLDVSIDIWVKDILPAGSVAGSITRKAAVETELPEGLLVITTAGDQPCGSLGAGLVKPGIMAINGGTSCTSEILSKKLPSRKEINYFIEISPTGDYFPEVSVHSGGSALMRWFKDNFASREIEIARKEKRDLWEVIYNEASQIPAGNLGLMMVPYLGGAGAPYWDLNARGVLFGIMLDHGRSHLVRAIMEGLSYETRRAMELIIKGTGAEIKEVRMYGGSSRSDIWNQIFADILDLSVYTTKTTETTALGAAICAAVGSGVYDTMEQAVEEMVHIDREYCPIDKNRKLYNKLYGQVYRQFYDKVYKLVRKSSRISRSE